MKPTLLLTLLSFAGLAYGSAGFITPSEMTMTFTGASLTTVDNSRKTIVASGTYPITFKKTDTDFAAVTVGTAGVEAGRYIGVQICYNSARSVKVNGDIYDGPTSGAISSGTALYSTGTEATAAGSVTTSVTASPTTLANYTVGNGTSQCSESYFVKPVCVTTSGTTGCEATDTVIDTSTTPPNLSVMLDMYDSVGVDAATGALDAHVPIYPYPAFGKPGAAVHLRRSSGGNIGNVSLIFGSDGNLVYSSLYQSGSNTGFCSIGGGVGFVTTTAVPSGGFQNAYGPSAVQKDTAGKIEFASGGCGTGSTCTSSGLQTITNYKVGVPNTTAVDCLPDTTGALGFTYTGTAAVSSPGTITVKRIIDPSNILGGICTTGGGICGDYL